MSVHEMSLDQTHQISTEARDSVVETSQKNKIK